MFKTVIIEDDPFAKEMLNDLLAKHADYRITGTFNSVKESIDKLPTLNPDLVFLDIQMPELSGIDFIKALNGKASVILTTAYSEFALESYELDAIDYLVKPIRIERFLKAVNKAENHLRLLQQEVSNSQVEKIEDDFVFIKADRKYFKIYFKDILYIEGLKDYVIIYTADNKIITSMNVKTIAARLPSSIFARVSKSYIVNVLHITSFDNELVYIQNNEIPLGQSFKDDFISQYIDGKIVRR